MGSKIVTVVDLGSAKILAVTAEICPDKSIEIKGIKETVSKGMQKGKVIDIQDLSVVLKTLISQLKDESGVDLGNLYVSISGNFIKYMNADGKITLSPEGKSVEIKLEHIAKVIEDAKESVLKQTGLENYEIIHTISKYYTIDNNLEQYKMPLMFSGTKLSGAVVTILAEKTALNNIRKCFELTGYMIDSFILSSYASALGVLSEQERDLGCIVIDIGAGISDAVIFSKKYIQAIAINLQGSEEITKDIYEILRTIPKTANDLKIGFSQLDSSKYDLNQEIEYRTFDADKTKKVKLSIVRDIIGKRIRASLELSYQDLIKNYKPSMISAGLVLTGGACNLKTYLEIARETFNLPVKIASPDLQNISGASTELSALESATLVGMLRYCSDNLKNSPVVYTKKFSFSKWINIIKNLFSE